VTGEIDARSDVYSLGVLLYELLIGAVPFDTATLRRAGLAEMLRIIREDDAPSLSEKLTSMGEAAATGVAARRSTDLVSLSRLVDGDLNAIALKALEKAPDHRYGSVLDLAADSSGTSRIGPCWPRRRARGIELGSFSAGTGRPRSAQRRHSPSLS